jgi:hypothetical protein
MARRFGSDSSPFQNQSVAISDPNGVPLIETNNTFGSSPMGIALREQAQFGLPNASFNLLPPDPSVALDDNENPLPFWQVQTTNAITATTVYDSTSQTWGVKIDPGTAPSGDYITLKTRSWVTTDDNLAIRQKASLTMAKVGTYSGSTQWNLTLSSVYYDHTNTAISTAIIGTVYDNTTWTSISGTTTTGGSAVLASASWVEFTIKLTATATVSSSTGVTLQSLLVATSSAATGSFVVVERFPSSTTWNPPTGVTALLGVVAVGGGGGGASSPLLWTTSTQTFSGAGGGGSGAFVYLRNLSINAGSAITIGIGTAGAGGAAPTTYTKAAGATFTLGTALGSAGGSGGPTTFGTFITAGAGGGAGGSVTGGTAPTNVANAIDGVFPAASIGGSGSNSSAAGQSGTNSVSYSIFPYVGTTYSGGVGGNGTVSVSPTGTNVLYPGVVGAAGNAGFGGSGGGAGWVGREATQTSGAGGYGGGGGAGATNTFRFNSAGTVVITGGAGGAGGQNTGGGAGASGGCHFYAPSASVTSSQLTLTGAAGGSGGAGYVVIAYVA